MNSHFSYTILLKEDIPPKDQITTEVSDVWQDEREHSTASVAQEDWKFWTKL